MPPLHGLKNSLKMKITQNQRFIDQAGAPAILLHVRYYYIYIQSPYYYTCGTITRANAPAVLLHARYYYTLHVIGMGRR